jgi:hypothetical protein
MSLFTEDIKIKHPRRVGAYKKQLRVDKCLFRHPHANIDFCILLVYNLKFVKRLINPNSSCDRASLILVNLLDTRITNDASYKVPYKLGVTIID